MAILIESLENRSLLSGGGLGGPLLQQALASTDPAVQAAVALVQADVSAIEAARQQIVAESPDTRPALKDVVRASVELIVADRKAVRDAKGDPAALELAKAKLDADRLQSRADIAAAREAFQNDSAVGRAALQEASASLRDDLRTLRSELKNAAPAGFAGAAKPLPAPVEPPVPTATTSSIAPTTPPESDAAASPPTLSSIPPESPAAPEPVVPPTPAPAPLPLPADDAPPVPSDPAPAAPTVPPPPEMPAPPEAVPAVAPETPPAEPAPDAAPDTSSPTRRPPPPLNDTTITFSTEEIDLAVAEIIHAVPNADPVAARAMLDRFTASMQDRRVNVVDGQALKADVQTLIDAAGLTGTEATDARNAVERIALTMPLHMDGPAFVEFVRDRPIFPISAR